MINPSDAARATANSEGGAAARSHWHPRALLRTGVFAVGDVPSGSSKRLASAVGKGAAAVRQIHDYLGGP